MAVTKPMMGVSAKSDLAQDIAYDYRRKVGRWVREHRLRVGMTQNQLAHLLGVGFSSVSATELGRSMPSGEQYSVLADTFGLPRAEVGKFLLRHTNPWLYAMIYGEREASLKTDLAAMSRLNLKE